jgi:hypothetical protein
MKLAKKEPNVKEIPTALLILVFKELLLQVELVVRCAAIIISL